MIKSVLTAGISLLALAATADAKTFGHVAGNVNYGDQDFFSSGSVDLWKYGLQGAVGFDVTPTWNVQFDAAFNADRYAGYDFFIEPDLNSYRAGTQIFWRDASQGMFGVEFAYQSTSIYDNSVDGFIAGLRGEYYVGDAYTLGGGVTYNTLDLYYTTERDADTWAGNVFATYYAGENIGVSLRAAYASTDIDSSFGTMNIWRVSADVEYLIQENLSLAGTVGYNTSNYFGSDDFDGFTVGAKLKFYFGTEGSLANQHRTSTQETSPTDLGLFLLD